MLLFQHHPCIEISCLPTGPCAVDLNGPGKRSHRVSNSTGQGCGYRDPAAIMQHGKPRGAIRATLNARRPAAIIFVADCAARTGRRTRPWIDRLTLMPSGWEFRPTSSRPITIACWDYLASPATCNRSPLLWKHGCFCWSSTAAARKPRRPPSSPAKWPQQELAC